MEYYEGEWYADKRSGWGRMYYADESVYEGEWYDDQRSGQGMLRLREYSKSGFWMSQLASESFVSLKEPQQTTIGSN